MTGMRHVQFTLEEAEHARLVALAKHKRQSIADLLRTLVERKWQLLFGDSPPEAPTLRKGFSR